MQNEALGIGVLAHNQGQGAGDSQSLSTYGRQAALSRKPGKGEL